MTARGGRPRIELDVHDVANAYTTGTPIAALAREHGVDRDVIRRCIDEAGAERRPGHVARIGDSRWWEQHANIPAGMLTSAELQARAGISYRQLDYWTRTGRLMPASPASPGSGVLRYYAATEASVAALMSRLLQDGIQLAEAHRMAREFTETGTATLGTFRLELPQEW